MCDFVFKVGDRVKVNSDVNNYYRNRTGEVVNVSYKEKLGEARYKVKLDRGYIDASWFSAEELGVSNG